MAPSRAQKRSPVDDLVIQGARLLRSAQLAPPGVKARDLSEVARVLVNLRECFHTEDGVTDWGGRSAPYREAVARMFSESGVVGTDLARMKSTIRYHVGNVLRENAPPAELEALGLQPRTPAERARDLRALQSARARAGAVIEGNAKKTDPLRLIVGAEVALTNLTAKRLDDLIDGAVEDAVSSLESIRSHSTDLLKTLEPRRKRRRGGIRRV